MILTILLRTGNLLWRQKKETRCSRNNIIKEYLAVITYTKPVPTCYASRRRDYPLIQLDELCIHSSVCITVATKRTLLGSHSRGSCYLLYFFFFLHLLLLYQQDFIIPCSIGNFLVKYNIYCYCKERLRRREQQQHQHLSRGSHR